MITHTNPYRALLSLLPSNPLQVCTVASVNTGTGTSIVTYPGGSVQTVRGTSVAAGHACFVRSGLIEGAAPDLPLIVIDV